MMLIDVDALMKEFAKFVRDSNNSDFASVPTWNDAVSLVGSASTIEPAPIWCDPEIEVPPDEKFVLALISGRINGTQHDSAPAIAEFWKDEGWFLTDIMPHKQDVWKVDAWMPIPEWGEPNG